MESSGALDDTDLVPQACKTTPSVSSCRACDADRVCLQDGRSHERLEYWRSKPGVGFFRDDESVADRVRGWREFCEKHKGNISRLKGRVTPPIEVPLLSLVDATVGEMTSRGVTLKELLVPDMLDLPSSTTIWVFSNVDRKRVKELFDGLPGQRLRSGEIDGYPDPNHPLDDAVWAMVLEKRNEIMDLDFD